MSSKDDFVFSKGALMSTKAGKEILKQALLRERGYKQYNKYKLKYETEFEDFTKRFLLSLHHRITSDTSPSSTLSKFAEEVGSQEMELDSSKIENIKNRLSRPEILADRVQRILDSNFVKMTFPVFNALFDGSVSYFKEDLSNELRTSIIDGHIIAIDLSEPMDRIIDKDEDIEYLDDYRLMNPYILDIAREKISQGGDSVLKAFEDGFKDARIGQLIDHKLKMKPESITDELMIGCYKKYRSIMGTAGRNMALNQTPLSEIYHLGMSKASESVGCGNEMQDAINEGAIKIPSWPLYYSLIANDVRKGFELTLKKSEIYLDEAKLALEFLPEEFELKPFLMFLFLTVNHYNQYWYHDITKRDLFKYFERTIHPLTRKFI
ncbi:MAG: hypothetical protein MUO21_10975 [Nitrososphaeraceae archaeon]|nr:hypothetical protein [Nitrososphaeraceae archaeon]